ncbi:MAG: ATP-binding protein [Lachnospiraceae bacterium]|nr:ATP-binding protein [Lachnospiraceae bacterium]
MYGYKDYFDEALFGKPYNDREEEISEYKSLIELMLEDYAGLKGLGTEEGLFSRGLLISEEEMKEYFINHPSLRENDSYYYVHAETVEDALSHIKSREEATKDKSILPLYNIKKSYGLNNPELLAVMLGFLNQKNRGYERVFGFLQDDIELNDATLGLLISLCTRAFKEDIPEAEEFISGKKGLFGSLFKAYGADKIYPLRSKLVLTYAAASYIRGGLSEGVPSDGLIKLYEKSEEPDFFEEEIKAVSLLLGSDEKLSCVYLEGKDNDAALHVAKKAAHKNKKKLCAISLNDIKNADEDKVCEAEENILFYGQMEGIALILNDAVEENVNDAFLLNFIKGLICSKKVSPILFSGSKNTPESLKLGNGIGEPVLHIGITLPDVKVRTAIWEYFIKSCGLSKEKGFLCEDLADCYEIGYKDIKSSVKQAKLNMLVNGLKKVNKDVMIEALKGIGTVNFKGLAKEVKTVYTWEDLCIGKEESRILKTACDRYKIKNRIGESWGISKKNAYGNGVSVLLYGPPGTGKTMSAQVVAREIGLPLYRVDTSQLFSKYIGETQKNLNAVFDEAETSNVILFFDEADALFSKRTDVESSNDRHANQEIAFLLQRIEEYKGMSILATNYYSGFDKAFVRRITYAVRLEQPDYETRLLLWKNTLPLTVPKEKDIDYEFLAENFELTGSNIKAILLSAAYMAGAEDKKLSMSFIVRAMKYEFDKLGMMPDSGKFGQYAAYLYG